MRNLAVVLLAVSLPLSVFAQDEDRLVIGQMGSGDFLKPGAIPGKVTVYVNGKETTGKAGEELSGSRQFSVPVPKGASVKVVAQDTDQWVFVQWTAVPGTLLVKAAKSGDTNATQTLKENRELSFTLGDSPAEFVNAEFSYRLDHGKFDLVADYDALLKEIKLTEKEAGLHGVNGGQEYNTTLPGKAAVSLINAAMKQRTKSDNLHDCVEPKEVWQSFCKNLKELDKALPMASPAARRAIAAFANSSSTDYKFWALIASVVKRSYGVDLGDVHFDTIGGHWFGTDGNADGDYLSNVAEWLVVLEKAGPDATMEKKLQTFTEMALDPNQPGKQ